MDVRYAIRAMLRNPGFAALVILTMAVGIGVNTTMFSVVRAVFLRPLPYPDPDRLVTLWENDSESGIAGRRVSPANFVDWRARNTVFEELGVLPNWAGASTPFHIVGSDGVQRVYGSYASSGFFRVLGASPAMGRTFGADEDQQAGQRKVIISDSYWREQLDGDPSVLGKTLDVDTFRGGKFTIIGVMPPAFQFPSGAKIWLSLGDWGAGPLPPVDSAQRCCAWFTVFGRLKPGVTYQQAESEMSLIGSRLSQQHPGSSKVKAVRVIPLRETLVGDQRLALFALFGAVTCVLLIGCANVANLLLSRGIARRREMQTRMALGATKWRVARQLLLESLLLSGLGAAAGLLIVVWTQGPLAGVMKESVPLIEGTRIDWTVVAFAAFLTVVSGLLCGLAPLIQTRALDWKSRGQTGTIASTRLRHGLIVGEVALAVTLVAGTGLFVRTLAKLQAVDLGFQTEQTLTLSLDVTTGPLRGRGNSARFVEEVIPRLATLPGVRTAAATTELPLDRQDEAQAITREGQPAVAASESAHVLQSAVTPNYFTAMGITVKAGRPLSDTDSPDGKLVAVLNETAAKRYWPGENPIGKRFAIGSRERFGSFRAPSVPGAIEWREIVGVVADVRSTSFGAEPQPEVYYSYRQFPLYQPKLILRTQGDPMALAAAVRNEVASINKHAVITRVRSMDDVAATSIRQPRFRTALLGMFSVLALALAMLGIYGAMSYTVTQQTQEIGIRVALGAASSGVAWMIIGRGLRLAALGVLLGLAGAFVVGRWISSLLFEVDPVDPVTLSITCLTILGAAALASCLPARKALRVDPVVALRSE